MKHHCYIDNVHVHCLVSHTKKEKKNTCVIFWNEITTNLIWIWRKWRNLYQDFPANFKILQYSNFTSKALCGDHEKTAYGFTLKTHMAKIRSFMYYGDYIGEHPIRFEHWWTSENLLKRWHVCCSAGYGSKVPKRDFTCKVKSPV